MGNLCSAKLEFDATGFALDIESIEPIQRPIVALKLQNDRKQYDKKSRKEIMKVSQAILDRSLKKNVVELQPPTAALQAMSLAPSPTAAVRCPPQCSLQSTATSHILPSTAGAAPCTAASAGLCLRRSGKLTPELRNVTACSALSVTDASASTAVMQCLRPFISIKKAMAPIMPSTAVTGACAAVYVMAGATAGKATHRPALKPPMLRQGQHTEDLHRQRLRRAQRQHHLNNRGRTQLPLALCPHLHHQQVANNRVRMKQLEQPMLNAALAGPTVGVCFSGYRMRHSSASQTLPEVPCYAYELLLSRATTMPSLTRYMT